MQRRLKMREIYKEIDLREIIISVLKKWWLILIISGILGGVAFYVTDNHIMEMYEATTTLFIGKDSEGLADFSINDLALDNKLVSDYKELIQTKLVTEQVIGTLGLNYSRLDVIEHLTIEVVNDSRFMRLSYKDPDPVIATDVVNLLSEVLTDKAESIVGASNVKIVDEADIPIEPISPSMAVNVILATALGIMIALLFIFTQMIMDNSIKKESEIEKLLGIPVLGMIPKFEGKVRR